MKTILLNAYFESFITILKKFYSITNYGLFLRFKNLYSKFNLY